MTISSDTKKIKNNYFDGIKVTKNQLAVFILIASMYFFEQFDNSNFSYIAPSLMSSLKITTKEIGMITSLYYLGNTFGAILGGIFSDIIGRRKMLLTSVVLFTVGSFICGFATNLTVFIWARAMVGFGMMCAMVTAITYMAEMSPKESRGKWEALICAVGYFSIPFVGFLCAAVIPLHPNAWRLIFYLSGLGIVVFIIGLFKLKESPRWLVSRGKVAEAEEVVYQVCGVPVDLSDVIIPVKGEKQVSKDLKMMFSPTYIKRTVVLIFVLGLAVISNNILIPWMTTMLKMSGFSTQASIIITTIGTFGAPLGQLLAAYYTDKGGRKIPIAISSFLTAVSLAICIWLFMAHLMGAFLFAVLSLLINMLMMARNFIIHPYVSESYPTTVRNTATGLLNGIGRFGSSGAQLLVPMIFAGYGIGGVLGFVALLSLVVSLIVLAFGWRSALKSLEDINENLTA